MNSAPVNWFPRDCIHRLLRGEEKSVLSQWQSLATAETAMLFSAISAAEIWAAARSSEHVQITNAADRLDAHLCSSTHLCS
jgi:hypothetical protein